MKARVMGTSAALAMIGVVCASGCSGEPAERTERIDRSNQAIQGGTDDVLHTYAVGVCGGSPNNCNLFCSGTLIAPNLVVTARHCVSQVPSGAVDCASTNFGAQQPASRFYVTTGASMMSSATATWFQVASIVTPTPTALCGNDLALLVLRANVPASQATPATPNVIYDLRDHVHLSTTQTAIGYGIDAPGTQTEGTRRIRQNIPITCIPHDSSGVDCYSDPQAIDFIKEAEYAAGDGTCEGDSGSGPYEQLSFNSGKPIVLGALSRGGVSLDGTTCQGAIYTRLDSWRQLIIDTGKKAALAGGYTPPAWTNAPPPPPPSDGGTTAPPKDSGATPASDASTGALGAACVSNDDCDAKDCSSIDGTAFVCTEACGSGARCPDGFACKSGFCFAGAAPMTPPNAATTTTTSGCSVARASADDRSDPSKPVPWVGCMAIAIVTVLRLRRRRECERSG
jgi:V8-like Glu-specific endopeptidase